MFDPKKKAVDWAVYRHRGKWHLFTLACLVHRLDPRAVLDDAHLQIRKHGGPASEVLLNDTKDAAAMLYDSPELFLIEPVGATLERMKTATGLPYAGAIACEQARALADSLGLAFPAELMPTLRQQPAPQAEAPAVGASGGGAVPAPDPERRLARLRELGGSATYRRNEWKFTGINALVNDERNEGRKRRDEKTIRADLREAAEAEREAKRAGPFDGLTG